MTNVAFDAVGSAGIFATGAPNLSVAFDAAEGADIFLAIVTDRQIVPANVKCGSASMPLVDSQLTGNTVNAGNGAIYWYRLAGAGTGSIQNLTATIGSAWWAAVPYSATNVESVDVVKSFGNTASISSGAIELLPGQMAVCALGIGNDTLPRSMVSPTGGNSRYFNGNIGAGSSSGLYIADSIDDGVEFGASVPGGIDSWAAVTLILSSSDVDTTDILLGSGEMAISFGSPVLQSAGNVLDLSLGKLRDKNDSTWLWTGDSTAWGQHDEDRLTGYALAGRMAIACGTLYGANVELSTLNYPNSETYLPAVSLYTPPGGSDFTLTVWLGAWPGGTMANYFSNAGNIFTASGVDFVGIQTGFNETDPAQWGEDLLTFVDDIQATYCPGAPILATTENYTTIPNEANHPDSFAQIWAALLGDLLPGASLPLSPVVRASTALAGVWVMDTQQAGMTSADLYSDGLHPVASGYDKMADLATALLVADISISPGLLAVSGSSVAFSAADILLDSAVLRVVGGPVGLTPDDIVLSSAVVSVAANAVAFSAPDVMFGSALVSVDGGLILLGEYVAPGDFALGVGRLSAFGYPVGFSGISGGSGGDDLMALIGKNKRVYEGANVTLDDIRGIVLETADYPSDSPVRVHTRVADGLIEIVVEQASV